MMTSAKLVQTRRKQLFFKEKKRQENWSYVVQFDMIFRFSFTKPRTQRLRAVLPLRILESAFLR